MTTSNTIRVPGLYPEHCAANGDEGERPGIYPAGTEDGPKVRHTELGIRKGECTSYPVGASGCPGKSIRF